MFGRTPSSEYDGFLPKFTASSTRARGDKYSRSPACRASLLLLEHRQPRLEIVLSWLCSLVDGGPFSVPCCVRVHPGQSTKYHYHGSVLAVVRTSSTYHSYAQVVLCARPSVLPTVVPLGLSI